MYENVTVCITPKGEKPVLHFSQFDNENVFTVTVLADDGESAAVLTGLDIEFRLRKTDSHVVTIAPESVADNVITFKTTEQMCACCGQNIATVTLMKDDMVVSTLDILVDIQRDILSGGLTSESDIRNLTTQIEQIVPEVVGDDYYNKQEVDELIAEIPTFDPSNYYDKSDVDGLLADKADADDVYTKSDVYNKTETDNLLSAKMDNIGYHGIVDDAAVISFTTDCKAPLDIIKGKITPVQSGSGTPSPDNVRPISGFSALNVTRTGVNLGNFQNGYGIDASGNVVVQNNRVSTVTPIIINPSLSYYVKGENISDKRFIYAVFKDNTLIRRIANVTGGTLLDTTNGNKLFVCLYDNATVETNKPMVVFDNSITTYEPYNGQTATVNFGQTVYGGVADVTNGKVNVTHGIVDLGNLNWASTTQNRFYSGGIASLAAVPSSSSTKIGLICSHYEEKTADETYLQNTGIALATNGNLLIYDSALVGKTAGQVKTALTGVQLVYELATPTEITTTPETVSSIAGDNNIFLDTGNLTEIAYFEGAEDNLIKLIKACQI